VAGVRHAFLYSEGVMRDLGTLGGPNSEATAIGNFSHAVVGFSDVPGGGTHAFIYTNGAMADLNTYLPSGSGWVLDAATAINASGTDADALYGEDGNDTLYGGTDFQTDILVGGNGNDVLHGDSGLGDYDLMDGGAGDDIYYVDTPADLTFEAAADGNDTVYANISGAGYYLYANVENLVLLGTTPYGVGNELVKLQAIERGEVHGLDHSPFRGIARPRHADSNRAAALKSTSDRFANDGGELLARWLRVGISLCLPQRLLVIVYQSDFDG